MSRTDFDAVCDRVKKSWFCHRTPITAQQFDEFVEEIRRIHNADAGFYAARVTEELNKELEKYKANNEFLCKVLDAIHADSINDKLVELQNENDRLKEEIAKLLDDKGE